MSIKLAENMKRLRAAKGWDQQELAKKVGICQAHVSHFECERRYPSLPNLFKIKKAFGCTFDDLLLDNQNNSK